MHPCNGQKFCRSGRGLRKGMQPVCTPLQRCDWRCWAGRRRRAWPLWACRGILPAHVHHCMRAQLLHMHSFIWHAQSRILAYQLGSGKAHLVLAVHACMGQEGSRARVG
jgi:hypothetical protein